MSTQKVGLNIVGEIETTVLVGTGMLCTAIGGGRDQSEMALRRIWIPDV